MADHDALYHRLFSHPGMVAQLLREFVAEPWVETLDLEAMERVNAKFHGEAGERRDGDVIWRIPAGDGTDVYIYLLLEFQSTPERWMALRAMVYVGLLWQQLIREKRLAPDGRLPPVLPIVLYNGDPRWAMPLSLRDLIALPAESPFWRWQPDMAYHVVDEGAWPADDLARRDSLAALLFRLEHCRDPDEVVRLVDDVIGWFRGHPGFEALGPVFAMLAGRLIAAGEGADTSVRVSENLLEVRTMLATRMDEWKQQWKQQGVQLGVAKGEAAVLVRLLERRFGALPGWARDKISSADTVSLEEWSLRVLDAKSLDEVFH
jgi:hypothetical protein